NFGTWSEVLTMTFDRPGEAVHATGELTVALSGPVASAGADLNLGKTASNFLVNVPRQTDGPGNTGDMRQIDVRYSPGADPRNFTWVPTAGTTFPGDTSGFLSLTALGETNAVDTRALGNPFQIAVA